jgi:hypothetical protein
MYDTSNRNTPLGDRKGLHEFAWFGEVAETTTQLLSLSLQHHTTFARRPGGSTRKIDPVEQYVLQQARDLMAQVREGFVLSVRATQAGSKAELRFLIDRVLHDWKELSEELGLQTGADSLPGSDSQGSDSQGSDSQASPSAAADGSARQSGEARRLERLRHQLLAYGMAATALGSLPRTPAEDVTFPYSFGKPPTYCDIPAPATPAAMLQRIEELETMLWKLMAADLQDLVNHAYGPLRRTYGFFEVSARLANQETARFGIKRTRIT